MYGLDKTKEAADKIQAISEGNPIDNQLGTNIIHEPIEAGLEEYNKGAEFGIPHQSHYVLEGIFDNKKPKTGSFRPNVDEDEPPSFVKEDVRAERQKQSEAGDQEDTKMDILNAYANKLGIEPIAYRRLLFVKVKNPEKLEAYKKEEKLEYIQNNEILTPKEIFEKMK